MLEFYLNDIGIPSYTPERIGKCRCRWCEEEFFPGEWIAYEKGSIPWHVDCVLEMGQCDEKRFIRWLCGAGAVVSHLESEA